MGTDKKNDTAARKGIVTLWVEIWVKKGNLLTDLGNLEFVLLE